MIVTTEPRRLLAIQRVREASSKRGAFTLIETLVAVTIGSLLALLAIQLLHRSFDISSFSRQQLQQELTLNRLARDLRQDLGMASSLSLQADRQLEMESVDGERISWEILDDGGVSRKSSDGRLQASELYPLMAGHNVRFSITPVPDQPWQKISIDIRRESDLDHSKAKLLRRIEVFLRSTLVSNEEPTVEQ